MKLARADTLSTMDPRNVPLPDGVVGWVFPGVVAAEAERVAAILTEADDILHRAGQIQGAAADATVGGVPLNRFYYQRLGPEPDFTATVLMAEGGHDLIETFVGCLPGGGPIAAPGPPWRVFATITLPCDSDAASWHRHEVLLWEREHAQNPLDAAHQVLAAASWVLDHASDTPAALRQLDPLRGHQPLPEHRDQPISGHASEPHVQQRK
jgi:hypothetical protein